MILLLLSVKVLSCSPERVLDSNVSVHSDGQQAKDGALGEHEDEAGNKEASIEVSTEAGADTKKSTFQENFFSSKKPLQLVKNDNILHMMDLKWHKAEVWWVTWG